MNSTQEQTIEQAWDELQVVPSYVEKNAREFANEPLPVLIPTTERPDDE